MRRCCGHASLCHLFLAAFALAALAGMVLISSGGDDDETDDIDAAAVTSPFRKSSSGIYPGDSPAASAGQWTIEALYVTVLNLW